MELGDSQISEKPGILLFRMSRLRESMIPNTVPALNDNDETPLDFVGSPTAARFPKLGQIRDAFGNVVDGVRQFVEFPFDKESAKKAQDTLAALEPFFWLLRIFGLCPLVTIFFKSDRVSTQKRWNFGLSAYCGIIGTFLWIGFFATFGFSMVWPVAFCAGFQTIINETRSYCRTDIMQRFLTPKGLNTLVQSSFMFIGAVNILVSVQACVKLRPMVKLLREYYGITRAVKTLSHSRMAIIHAVLTVVVAAAIGIPFTYVYEEMLENIKAEQSYEGYPFADIDSPLVKIENWIAYTMLNHTESKANQFVLRSLKLVFRAENFFMFVSCFAVPFFFSLMCDVLAKEWKSFVVFLRLETTRNSLSVTSLRNIRNSHWMLCKLFDFLDDCFAVMILIIYVLFIVVNSSIIYIVLKYGAIATGRDRFAFYQAILMFAALEIIFFFVVRQAMHVHTTATQVVEEVRNWQLDMDGTIDAEYLLLVNQVTCTNTSFTAWRCFRIEEAAYINALAIIFSYVLMLLQYQAPEHSASSS